MEQDPVLCPEGWERTFLPHFSLTSNLCHKILGSGRVIRAGGAGIFFIHLQLLLLLGLGLQIQLQMWNCGVGLCWVKHHELH